LLAPIALLLSMKAVFADTGKKTEKEPGFYLAFVAR
jgi:hypothetical protein